MELRASEVATGVPLPAVRLLLCHRRRLRTLEGANRKVSAKPAAEPEAVLAAVVGGWA